MGFSDEIRKSEYNMNHYVETAPEFGNEPNLTDSLRAPHGGKVR